MRTEYNRLVVDLEVLSSLHLTREEVSCYYKYINWVDDDTYTFEEVISI